MPITLTFATLHKVIPHPTQAGGVWTCSYRPFSNERESASGS